MQIDSVTISFLIAVIGCIIGLSGWYFGRKKDTQVEDGKLEDIRTSIIKANMKLDNVCAVTSDIKTDIKSMNNQLRDQDRRITMLERDMKTAFSKLDEMRGVYHE